MTILNPFKKTKDSQTMTDTTPHTYLPEGFDDNSSPFYVPEWARPHWAEASASRTGLDHAITKILRDWAFEEHPRFAEHKANEDRLTAALRVNPRAEATDAAVRLSREIALDAHEKASSWRNSDRYEDARLVARHRSRLEDARRLVQLAETKARVHAETDVQQTCELCQEVKRSTRPRTIERSALGGFGRSGATLKTLRSCEDCTLDLQEEVAKQLIARVSQETHQRIAQTAASIVASL